MKFSVVLSEPALSILGFKFSIVRLDDRGTPIAAFFSEEAAIDYSRVLNGTMKICQVQTDSLIKHMTLAEKVVEAQGR